MADKLEKLEKAIVKAYQAGNEDHVRILAKEIKKTKKAREEYVPYTPVPAEDPMSATEFAKSYAESMARGLTFNAYDYLKAFAAGAGAKLGGGEYLPSYKAERERTENRRQKFYKEAPATAMVGEILPSMVTGLGTAKAVSKLGGGKAAQLLAGTAESAGAGALGTYGGGQEKLIGGAIGLGTGLVGTGLGLALPAKRQISKSLMEKDIPLTLGQERGGFPELAEEVMGQSIFGSPLGVIKAQAKSFEGFHINKLDDILEPLSLTASRDLEPREAYSQAVNSIKNAFQKSVEGTGLDATGEVIRNFKALSTEKNADRLRKSLNMTPAHFEKYQTIIKNAVIDRVEDLEMTGEMLQDSLSALGEAASLLRQGKKSFGVEVDKAAGRRIGAALEAYRQNLLDQVQRKAKNPKAFLAAREAYRRLVPVKEAMKGKDVLTPVNYKKSLERNLGEEYTKSAEYKKLKPFLEVLGEGSYPTAKATGYGVKTPVGLASTLGLLSTGGLAGYLSPAALAGIGLGGTGALGVYRGGDFGRFAGSLLTDVAGGGGEILARTPAVPSIASGILFGEEVERQ